MKLLTKILLAAAVSSASVGAFAQNTGNTCATLSGTHAPAAKGGLVTYTAADGNVCYMQTSFQSPVSANVGLEWVQNNTAAAVATWNTKGRNHYTGSSEGGRVAQCGDPTTGSKAPTGKKPVLTAANGCQ